jgi:type IV pilus assembly protein PilB
VRFDLFNINHTFLEQPMASTIPGFAEILIRRKTISNDQFLEADQVARDTNELPQDTLIKLGYATPEEVMRAVAEEHRVEFVDIMRTKIPDDVIQLVPESVARENNVMPIDELDGVLRVAISNPSDVDTIEKLRFILNRDVRISLAPIDGIRESINRLYGQIEGESADSILQEFTDTAIDFTETEDADFGAEDDGLVDENSAPVVKLVQLMIQEAVQLRASDIHVEPFENRVRIRYRIDGILHERDNPPRRLLGPLLSRIKIISKIDIAERRRPQDGRIKITAGEKELDLRVSVIPTNHGQSVVMRLLDPDNIKVGIRQLGFSEKNFKEFNQLIKRPNGIILVTGPTGSGKTTTLYAAMSALNRPDRKIITAEDPVEYYLQGINQVQVNHKIGLDFSRIIRSMLRQAPNIILVGEMRDQETASIGIEASLTGHLVFSTLHTNDAPSAVTRMVDMGVPGYLVASSVIAIMAQRLVRTICPKCRQKYRPSDEVLEEIGFTPEQLETATFMRGKGCNACSKSGYKGRIGIYELMIVNNKVRELVFAGANTTEIRKLAIEQGMNTLYLDGLEKVLKGVTTIEEVYRVAKKTEQD